MFCFPLLLLLFAHSFSVFGFGQRAIFFTLARLFFSFISFSLLYSCILILQPLLDFSALCRFAAAVCIGSQKLQEGSSRNSFIPVVVVVVVVTKLLLICGIFLVHWIINESLRNSLDQ